jgi:hypothetical protein
MLMRERSGRSGRRRGSQKPGTAAGSIGEAAVPGGVAPPAGGEPGGPFVVCACADAVVTTVSITKSAHTRSQRVPDCSLIRRSFARNRGDHSIAMAVG